MIVAGKTKFQVINDQSGESWLEATFDNIQDAEDCVYRLAEDNEDNTWFSGVIVQESTENNDVLYHKYYDFS